MAEYNPTGIGMLTSVRAISENVLEEAEDGTVRGQDLNAQTAYEITIRHELITVAEFLTLETARLANLSAQNTITAFDGYEYTFLFRSKSYTVEAISSERMTISIVVWANREDQEPGGGGGGGETYIPLSVDFTAESLGTGSFGGDARYRRFSDGVYALGDPDVPRYQYGLDGEIQGVLLERAVSHLLTATAGQFGTSDWTKQNLVEVATDETDIFESTDAYWFEEGTAAGTHQLSRDCINPPSPNTPVVLYAVVRYVDAEWVSLMLRTRDGLFPIQRFNIHPDNYGVGSNSLAGVTQYARGVVYLGQGFFLIYTSFDSRSVGVVTAQMRAYLTFSSDDGSTNNITGTERGMFVSCFNCHEGYYPLTPHVITSNGATAIPLSADVLTYDAVYMPANDFYVALTFIGKYAVQTNGSPTERYLFQSGNVSIRVTDDDIIVNIGGNTLSFSATIQIDQIYNVGLGRDSSQGTYLYVNGDLRANSGAAGFVGDVEPDTIYVGCDSNQENHADVVFQSISIGEWEAP